MWHGKTQEKHGASPRMRFKTALKLPFSWRDGHQTQCLDLSWVLWHTFFWGKYLSSGTFIEKDSHSHSCVLHTTLNVCLCIFYQKVYLKNQQHFDYLFPILLEMGQHWIFKARVIVCRYLLTKLCQYIEFMLVYSVDVPNKNCQMSSSERVQLIFSENKS